MNLLRTVPRFKAPAGRPELGAAAASAAATARHRASRARCRRRGRGGRAVESATSAEGAGVGGRRQAHVGPGLVNEVVQTGTATGSRSASRRTAPRCRTRSRSGSRVAVKLCGVRSHRRLAMLDMEMGQQSLPSSRDGRPGSTSATLPHWSWSGTGGSRSRSPHPVPNRSRSPSSTGRRDEERPSTAPGLARGARRGNRSARVVSSCRHTWLRREWPASGCGSVSLRSLGRTRERRPGE